MLVRPVPHYSSSVSICTLPSRDPVQIVEIESAIGCGQVEELVDQAKGELILIPEYASWCVPDWAWGASDPRLSCHPLLSLQATLGGAAGFPG